MRVIVIGTGEVGQHIAGALSDEQHDVTVVERDEERTEMLQNQLDALVISGNGASPKFLAEIGARHADLLLAVTETDEVNVLAAAAGHKLGVTRTLARVRDPDYYDADDDFVREVLGIDLLIDPERATANDIVSTLLVPGAVHVEYFSGDKLALAEVVLSERSSMVGNLVREREQIHPHSIVGIIRHGKVTIPASEQRLEVGDHLMVAAASGQVAGVIADLDGDVEHVGDVVVFGGGKIGHIVASRLLAEGFDVKVIEQSAARALYLAKHLPGALILHEEDLSEEALLTHGVDRAGAFVACAGDDRTNLLATMFAKRLGAFMCLAVVSREQYVPLVDALDIDAAFSLRLNTAEAIMRFVRRQSVRTMHLLLCGAEALELQADPGSSIVGRRVDGTGPFEHCEVGAIVRGDEVLIPGPDDQIAAGDRVLLFRLPGEAEAAERSFDA